jgi:hypothetical protein
MDKLDIVRCNEGAHLRSFRFVIAMRVSCAASTDLGSWESKPIDCGMDLNPRADEIVISSDKNSTQSEEHESYMFHQMYAHLDCHEYVRRQNKPLYTSEMWMSMRTLFAAQASIDVSTFDFAETYSTNYYSGYAGSKGRGLFAARDISQGELVMDGSANAVFWNDSLSWNKYILSLPIFMACDLMEAAWIQKVGDFGHRICADLNDVAFMNHDWNSNLAPKHIASLKFYAARGESLLELYLVPNCLLNPYHVNLSFSALDIKKGDELTFNYDIFDTNWELFGL